MTVVILLLGEGPRMGFETVVESIYFDFIIIKLCRIFFSYIEALLDNPAHAIELAGPIQLGRKIVA